MAHRALGLVVSAVLLFGVWEGATADPGTTGPVEVEQYGSTTSSDGNDVPIFVVVCGRPKFSPDRAGLATLVGTYLANGTLWTQKLDGTWTAIDYRVPRVQADFVALRNEGVAILEQRQERMPGELPLPVGALPPELLKNVRSFIHFYSGALRIYLVDQSRSAAERVTGALSRMER